MSIGKQEKHSCYLTFTPLQIFFFLNFNYCSLFFPFNSPNLFDCTVIEFKNILKLIFSFACISYWLQCRRGNLFFYRCVSWLAFYPWFSVLNIFQYQQAADFLYPVCPSKTRVFTECSDGILQSRTKFRVVVHMFMWGVAQVTIKQLLRHLDNTSIL